MLKSLDQKLTEIKSDPTTRAFIIADAKDAEQFERGFASATRTDELRATGQLNLASPWTKAVHGERAYYRRLRSDPVGAFARTTEATLLMPTEGLCRLRGCSWCGAPSESTGHTERLFRIVADQVDALRCPPNLPKP